MKWHQKESGSLLKEKSRCKHTHTHIHTHTHPTVQHASVGTREGLAASPFWSPIFLSLTMEITRLFYICRMVCVKPEWKLPKKKKIPQRNEKKKSDCSWPVRSAHDITLWSDSISPFQPARSGQKMMWLQVWKMRRRPWVWKITRQPQLPVKNPWQLRWVSQEERKLLHRHVITWKDILRLAYFSMPERNCPQCSSML